MARPEEIERRFHEEWIGMVQPAGLVVSTPVLLEAQIFQRNPPSLQQRLRGLEDSSHAFESILEIPADRWHRGESLPKDLAHYHERSAVVPSAALRRVRPADEAPPEDLVPDTTTPATRAGESYELLVLEADDFDKPDRAAWSYPPALKLERLLRDTRVPVGLLVSRRAIRLVYAPHGQAAGSLQFDLDAMADPGGRQILDAFVMLLRARRIDDPEWPLRRLLDESRTRQANVTTALARQVFDALQILLDGLATAEGGPKLAELDEPHATGGLLTVLLRMVFVLYAEDRGLLPMNDPVYGEHLSLLGLHGQLLEDRAAFPDTMGQRHGAWPRVLALFRTLYEGARHGDLHIPARRGELFDPARFPFLEKGPARVADGVLLEVVDRLLVLDRERVSYRSLDVEQIGSVYEKLMGYHVWSADAEAVCLRGEGAWVTGAEVLVLAPAQRQAFLVEERGLPKKDGETIADALKAAKKLDDALRALDQIKKSGTERNAPGRLVLQPGPERRRTSSHYTPRSLSEPVVRRALEPLLAAMGGTPTAAQILELKVCDPAMGSGAFLVEACRFLADQVVAAWARDPACIEPPDPQERLMHARRLVAQRCLYGVDKNAMAVTLGRLSMWLITMAADEPFTFVDHALKHGDSLVGLTVEQIRAFNWSLKKGESGELFATLIDKALRDALDRRQAILAKATCDTETCFREKEKLLGGADQALARAKLIGDVCVGAWFAGESAKEREAERKRRLDLVSRWMATGGEPPAELVAMQRALRSGDRGVPAFHWMLEFPEVFYEQRPDPLDGGKVGPAAWMDAFVGNPPFMGKNGISDSGGLAYLPWLQMLHDGAHGNADYVAHFFRRADFLLGEHGTIGFVATKTIGQGDTRAAGLQALVQSGAKIYDAIPIMRWPGEKDAAVSIATVHVAKGRLTTVDSLGCVLEGRAVSAIDSRLRAGHERPDPVSLAANANLSFVGSYVLGMGFTLTLAEHDALIAKDRRNAERIFPYLGGEEVNTSPTQAFDRYVVNFGDVSLEEAERWPDLISIVRAKVKPDRDKLINNPDGRRRKAYWWQFGRSTPALYRSLMTLKRCLVWSIHSKHLIFAWQPIDRVFSHGLIVGPIQDGARFAVLQSRIHERWARLLASTMKADLRYTPSDCFENFPFPRADKLAAGSLEKIGQQLYDARTRLTVAGNHGLTVLYNHLKDGTNADPEILAVRRLHEEMDRAVLRAYGWDCEIDVPPYADPKTPDERRALAAFEDGIIDRLFALNAERAAEEQRSKPETPARTKRAKR